MWLTLVPGPSLASTNKPPQIDYGESKGLSFWSTPGLVDVLNLSSDPILVLQSSSGRLYWSLELNRQIPASALPKVVTPSQSISAFSTTTLQNGGGVSLQFEGLSAKCGYTFGEILHYQPPVGQPKSGYILYDSRTPINTDYCGEPLKQRFDTFSGIAAGSLSDGRLLLIDFIHRVIVALPHLPKKEVASFDARIFIVPVELLQAKLSIAGSSQRQRYNALISVLQRGPGVSVTKERTIILK